jgi:putative oxidoreductase
MKLTSTIARLLLGLIFAVFGLNGFLSFIPMGPMPTGHAGEYMAVMFATHYLWFVSATQLIAGLLLLANRFTPLALVVIAPVIVNIILFHALMAPSGLPLATVVTVLWVLAALAFRPAFAGLLRSRPAA